VCLTSEERNQVINRIQEKERKDRPTYPILREDKGRSGEEKLRPKVGRKKEKKEKILFEGGKKAAASPARAGRERKGRTSAVIRVNTIRTQQEEEENSKSFEGEKTTSHPSARQGKYRKRSVLSLRR